MARWVVVGDCAYVQRRSIGWQILYRGAAVPDDVMPADVVRLVSIGLVGAEDDLPAPELEPQSGEPAPSQILLAVKATAEQAASMATSTASDVAGLQETSSRFQSAVAESRQDRAALHARADQIAAGLDALRAEVAAIQLTPGSAPTGEQIVAAVSAWMVAHPPVVPADAIAAAVSDWLAGHPPVEFRSTATAIQWRPYGGAWTDLVTLAAITGPAGTSPKMTAPEEPASLPALAVGNNDVQLAWKQAMPSTAYQVFPSLSGSVAILGKLSTVVKPGSLTKTGCTVTVTNSSVLPIAIGAGTVSALAFSPN